MSSSLSNLVKNLPAEAFKHTGQVFQGEQLSLMTKKGVYPYDYMNSFKKFEDNKLPKKEDFFSIMNNEHITDEEYQHAQNVWNEPSTLTDNGRVSRSISQIGYFIIRLMFLKISAKHVNNTMNWIPLIISHHPVLVGTQC